MGSMHTGLEEERGGFEKLGAFYEERARNGVALIVTGGFSPCFRGRLTPGAAQLSFFWQVRKHRKITQRVHAAGGKIALQILHAGRYAFHPFSVAPSHLKAHISPFKPRALSEHAIKSTIKAYANCAGQAQRAGYDGVEIMGSEGYLINEFIAAKTNLRTDSWGGSFENRMRFPVEIVRSVRARVGPDFIIIFRLSLIDLVEQGSQWFETVKLAQAIEAAGATLINTGIGWHEARIPTIATMVPRAAFTELTKQLKSSVAIPLITSNRINTPEVAEKVLSEGCADMVSMARPFLADPAFLQKAFEDHSDEINTCIACNQACLDHTFQLKRSTCLVNPRACFETEITPLPSPAPKKIAVVGAGVAGLSFAVTAAMRGHTITLFEAGSEIGGQFILAKNIPGKEEFNETLRYFRTQIKKLNIDLHLNAPVVDVATLKNGFDDFVIATGVAPRRIEIPGIECAENVMSYQEVLSGKKIPGKRVAIIGAGGIGFDMAEFLTHGTHALSQDPKAFFAHWGVDLSVNARGGVEGFARKVAPPARTVFLLQRKKGKLGAQLGKTTGWIHRISLKDMKVKLMEGVQYDKVSNQGLHVTHKGVSSLLEVDSIVICAGQNSVRLLYDALLSAGRRAHLIGGAELAVELDAKRAIAQGTRLGNSI